MEEKTEVVAIEKCEDRNEVLQDGLDVITDESKNTKFLKLKEAMVKDNEKLIPLLFNSDRHYHLDGN